MLVLFGNFLCFLLIMSYESSTTITCLTRIFQNDGLDQKKRFYLIEIPQCCNSFYDSMDKNDEIRERGRVSPTQPCLFELVGCVLRILGIIVQGIQKVHTYLM